MNRGSSALAGILPAPDAELEELRASIRVFVDRKLIPLEMELEHAGELKSQVWEDLIDRARDLGVWAFNYPVDAGGPGMPLAAQVVVRQEMGRTTMGLSQLASRPPLALLEAGSGHLREVARRIVAGEAEIAFAMTEAGSGSSLRSSTTAYAVDDGGGRWLNGEKHFVTGAPTASHVLVVAKDKSTPCRYTAAVVPASAAGVHIHPREKMGWKGWSWGDVSFDNVQIADEQLLGAPGQGVRVVMGHIEATRLGVSAHYTGTCLRALELAAESADSKTVSGGLLADQQGFRWAFASLAARLVACNELIFALARQLDEGHKVAPFRISSVKWLSSELAFEAADFALQTAGAGGYQSDAIENVLFRDARAFRIGEGTSEVQIETIAQGLLGEPA